MGYMGNLDIMAHNAGLTDHDRQTWPLAEVVATVECFDWQTAGRGLDAAARLLLARLECEGVPEPLGQTFTLGAVLNDLYAIMGQAVPVAVARLVG